VDLTKRLEKYLNAKNCMLSSAFFVKALALNYYLVENSVVVVLSHGDTCDQVFFGFQPRICF
jgi:hypothetical protein